MGSCYKELEKCSAMPSLGCKGRRDGFEQLVILQLPHRIVKDELEVEDNALRLKSLLNIGDNSAKLCIECFPRQWRGGLCMRTELVRLFEILWFVCLCYLWSFYRLLLGHIDSLSTRRLAPLSFMRLERSYPPDDTKAVAVNKQIRRNEIPRGSCPLIVEFSPPRVGSQRPRGARRTRTRGRADISPVVPFQRTRSTHPYSL